MNPRSAGPRRFDFAGYHFTADSLALAVGNTGQLRRAWSRLYKQEPSKRVMCGRKEQITLTTAPELPAKVDAPASRMGQSRAALINRAIYALAERVTA